MELVVNSSEPPKAKVSMAALMELSKQLPPPDDADEGDLVIPPSRGEAAPASKPIAGTLSANRAQNASVAAPRSPMLQKEGRDKPAKKDEDKDEARGVPPSTALGTVMAATSAIVAGVGKKLGFGPPKPVALSAENIDGWVGAAANSSLQAARLERAELASAIANTDANADTKAMAGLEARAASAVGAVDAANVAASRIRDPMMKSEALENVASEASELNGVVDDAGSKFGDKLNLGELQKKLAEMMKKLAEMIEGIKSAIGSMMPGMRR